VGRASPKGPKTQRAKGLSLRGPKGHKPANKTKGGVRAWWRRARATSSRDGEALDVGGDQVREDSAHQRVGRVVGQIQPDPNSDKQHRQPRRQKGNIFEIGYIYFE